MAIPLPLRIRQKRDFYTPDFTLSERTIDGVTHEYHYDNQQRLLENEAFDENDQSTRGVFNEMGQLIELGDVHCSYDPQGRMIKKDVGSQATLYNYDEKGRLSKVSRDDLVVTFEYDELGHRVAKQVYKEGKLAQDYAYIFMDDNEVGSIEKISKKSELRVPGRSYHKNVVVPVAIELNEKVYAPILDFAGNILKLVDAKSRQVAVNYEIAPFGDSIIASKKVFTPWVFASKRLDKETGLYYFGSRYYDPQLRRWTTPDPQGYIDSPNLYTYCKNNPLLYVDPDGELTGVVESAIVLATYFTIRVIQGTIANVQEKKETKRVKTNVDRESKKQIKKEAEVAKATKKADEKYKDKMDSMMNQRDRQHKLAG